MHPKRYFKHHCRRHMRPRHLHGEPLQRSRSLPEEINIPRTEEPAPGPTCKCGRRRRGHEGRSHSRKEKRSSNKKNDASSDSSESSPHRPRRSPSSSSSSTSSSSSDSDSPNSPFGSDFIVFPFNGMRRRGPHHHSRGRHGIHHHHHRRHHIYGSPHDTMDFRRHAHEGRGRRVPDCCNMEAPDMIPRFFDSWFMPSRRHGHFRRGPECFKYGPKFHKEH
uniref:Voltage-dependent P/Q-type calcium channel subunit alpha-1A-like n=1 Tax=Parastrongyloides trichosuri TaxID=131310 RepID=A0A0N4Z0V9_PARTI